MTSAPIILVPGWWLGAWAWDEVADTLRADGHQVTALTLPGLDSPGTDRSAITFEDHVTAIADAVRSAHAPVVLAVHSGTGFTGYAASDRVAEMIAAMVYVDTAPGIGAAEPDVEGPELPFPGLERLAAGENLDGLTTEQLEQFRDRAIPEPAGVVRQGAALTNEARLDLPSVVICTGAPSAQVKEWAKENYAFLAGLKEVRNLTWVDLPTSHWPMWSRPRDLAAIIADVASGRAPEDGLARP